jgi:hypothetical protein
LPWQAALVVGCLAVAALPSMLVWNTVRPRPWDSHTLSVRFESVRYEAAGLVFTYAVENRAWRSLRLIPEQTEVRLVPAAEQIPAGFPNLPTVLLLEGHTTQHIELRMELPAEPTANQPLSGEISGENGKRVLQQFFAGITAGNGLAALPPGSPAAAAMPMEIPQPDTLIEDTLRDVDGFRLVNPAKGVNLLFPRGW